MLAPCPVYRYSDGVLNVFQSLRDLPYVASLTTLVVVTIAAGALALSDSGRGDAGGAPIVQESPTAPAATPAVTATATPPPYADVLVDTKRLLDLSKIRESLERYHARQTTYPSTGGAFQTVCSQPRDAACVLLKTDPRLPVAEGENSYWYQSDGASFTLYTRLLVPPVGDGCPGDVPSEFDGSPVGCISGGGQR
jgi:hypothetical protein